MDPHISSDDTQVDQIEEDEHQEFNENDFQYGHCDDEPSYESALEGMASFKLSRSIRELWIYVFHNEIFLGYGCIKEFGASLQTLFSNLATELKSIKSEYDQVHGTLTAYLEAHVQEHAALQQEIDRIQIIMVKFVGA